MATTVIPAKIKIKFSIPINEDIGPAIAKPTGLNKSEPIASKDETRDSESRGTFFCNAVLQRVPHKSKVIPNKNAPSAIKANDCGFASDQI